MRPLIVVCSVFILISCNSGTDKVSNTDSTDNEVTDSSITYSGVDSSTEFLDTFSNEIVPWLQQSTKSNSVTLRGLRYAENWIEDSLQLSKMDVSKDFLKTYESMLVYSPDKSKILDLGSYGSVPVKDKKGNVTVQGDADSEIALIDLNTKTRRRLMFFGPGFSVDHGFWLNNSTVLLTGQKSELNTSVPMIWKIDLQEKSNVITRYEYAVR
jgi:hypothetical protein